MLESEREAAAKANASAAIGAAMSSRHEEEAERLRKLREEERANRDGMSATVGLGQAQCALLEHESFDM